MAQATFPTRYPAGEATFAHRLESGEILYFPDRPLAVHPDLLVVLLRQNPGHSRFHKNISYRPEGRSLGGVKRIPAGDREAIRRALEQYSAQATRFAAGLFPAYARSWRVEYASFRPYEEEGRPLSTRSRNDRMHVDAFGSRPTNGDRILRVFTNIHPTKPRTWISGGTFEHLAERFAIPSGILDDVTRRSGARVILRRLLRTLGLTKGERSAYDEFMRRFHDFLKRNARFQRNAPREVFTFAPGSTWVVFTDGVSHAVLSGRHALEQTFIVPQTSLVSPDRAPLKILERMAGGRRLTLGVAGLVFRFAAALEESWLPW